MEEAKKKICKSSGQWQQWELPEEMIFEILSRLSGRSLCRFQCVSQLWRSMIQSSLFVSAHRVRSSANPKLLLCVDVDHGGNGYNVFSTELKDKEGGWCYHRLTTSSNVLASEDGLICFCDSLINLKAIHIANPSTGECISIRPLPHLGNIYRTMVCFGYDPVENKHKVLVIRVHVESLKPISRFLTVDIFIVGGAGAGAEAWRRIIKPSGLPVISFSTRLQKHRRMSSICINGTIYLIGRDEELESFLISFDFRTETFRAIPIPEEAGLTGMFYCALKFGGAPAFIENPWGNLLGKDKLRMWILDDFCRQLWRSRDFLVPVSFSSPVQIAGVTSRGEVILSQIGSPALYFYQLENSTVKTIELPDGIDRPYDLAAFYHVENMQPLRDQVPTASTSSLGTEFPHNSGEDNIC